MTDILIKIAAVLALLAALFFVEQYIEGRGYNRAKAEDQAATNQLKAAAAAQLANAVLNTRAAEQALQDFKNTQELQDATHQKTVADLSDRLRRAAGPAGRLRDPNATGCGAGSGSAPGQASTAAGDRPADPTEAGWVFSAGATELLQRLTSEADEVNTAYASCRADAFAVRAPP